MIFLIGGLFLFFFLIGYRVGMEDNRLSQCDMIFKAQDFAETKKNFINDGVVFLEKGQLFKDDKAQLKRLIGTFWG